MSQPFSLTQLKYFFFFSFKFLTTSSCIVHKDIGTCVNTVTLYMMPWPCLLKAYLRKLFHLLL